MAKRHRRPRGKQPGAQEGLSGASREHWRADGTAKTRFASQDEANRAALRLRLEEGADLDPYQCGFCNGWHLGTRRS